MHHIKAEVILKSVNAETEDEITTLLLQYPRVIHSELMTHRLLCPFPEFAINTASSRAIPVKKWIERLKESHYIPDRFLANQKGMRAKDEEVENPALMLAFYEQNMHKTFEIADVMGGHGVSKQIVNRLIEPYQIIQCIVTATQWNNFFNLRDSPEADPLIRELAAAMKEAIADATALALKAGEWHLPFVDAFKENLDPRGAILVSAARCARVSYLIDPDEPPKTIDDDLALADKLISSDHISPLEHPSIALPSRVMVGSYIGWMGARKFLIGEDGNDIPPVPILNPIEARLLIKKHNPFKSRE